MRRSVSRQTVELARKMCAQCFCVFNINSAPERIDEAGATEVKERSNYLSSLFHNMKVPARNISFLQNASVGLREDGEPADAVVSPVKDDGEESSPTATGGTGNIDCESDIEKEIQRLLSLRSFHVLEQQEYQDCHVRFTSLAARYFHVPLAKIILVDMERCWSLACTGNDNETRDTERWGSIYDEAAKDPAPVFCVKDMECDARYQKMRSISGLEEYRFFASTPLISRDGHRIGVLAVMDLDPRPAPSVEDVIFLKDTASSLMDLLELKRSALRSGVNQSSTGLLRSARFVRDCLKDVQNDDELEMLLGEQQREILLAATTNAEILCSAFAVPLQSTKATPANYPKELLCTTSKSNRATYC